MSGTDDDIARVIGHIEFSSLHSLDIVWRNLTYIRRFFCFLLSIGLYTCHKTAACQADMPGECCLFAKIQEGRQKLINAIESYSFYRFGMI